MMYRFLLLLLLCGLSELAAQGSFQVERNLQTARAHVFEPLKHQEPLLEQSAQEMPKPGGLMPGLTAYQNARRESLIRSRSNNKAEPTPQELLLPAMEKGFEALSGSGTPNDNHVAVNNEGVVMSVLNTNIRVFNDTGKLLKTWGLASFARNPNFNPEGALPMLDRPFDPRVLFDQESNRWIVVFMNGTLHSNSATIVGFSTSSDPLQPWNVYRLSGNPLNDTTWSDYPIVALGTGDLFITLNQLKNNKGWQDGFVQSIIWQVNKSDGFQGKSLQKNLWHSLKFQGKSIWSICPAQGGVKLYPDMYFLSVRPADTLNDTLFIHKITGTQASGNASYALKVIRADKTYGYPPSALQPQGYKLACNDARVLHAVQTGKVVHYAQNSIHPQSLQPCIYHGALYDLEGTPEAKAQYITTDSLDFAYPAIAAAGNAEDDPSVLITFQHSAAQTFPGTSVVYCNRYREYSNILRIKQGRSIINYSFLPKDQQRWGDYEGIQKKYNESNTWYLVGSYGNGGMNAWISRLSLKDPLRQALEIDAFRVFPNPVDDAVKIELSINASGIYRAVLVNMKGQEQILDSRFVLDAGTHLLKLNTAEIASGVYYLKVYEEGSGQTTGTFKLWVR
ncbi:MAG: hypothetical protein RLZZ370_592 [Bacteroidota bacterium]